MLNPGINLGFIFVMTEHMRNAHFTQAAVEFMTCMLKFQL